ncbi:MAG TPA: biopolymer transporter ExbD [Bacteroidales bacterium]|jgi:biopolymer transport protein ExbD|nr:biopolymer transporter ExbD [Bacteroidales bacterium]
MAEIIQEEKGEGKKKAKKHAPHIDMTPMVDLMCLLITFFMLTTAFSKAKVMEINLPEKIKDPNQAPPKIVASRTLNLILGPDNKIYWYPGGVKPEDYNNLPPVQEMDFSDSPNGLRYMLLERNRSLFRKIDEYKAEVKKGTYGNLDQDSVTKAVAQMKKDDDTGPIVLIKAYKEAKYGDFVDILDEMNICGIARYTFVPIAWYEEKMVETAAGITPSASTSAPAK